MTDIPDNGSELRQIAYFFTGSSPEGADVMDWFKTLLLFFDGFAFGVLSPESITGANEELFGPLDDLGMIVELDESLLPLEGPTLWELTEEFDLNEATIECLAEAIDADAYHLWNYTPDNRASMLGRVLTLLFDGMGLVFYRQVHHTARQHLSIDLEMISDMPRYAQTMMQVVGEKSAGVTAASIIALDTQAVTFNLSSVPLDEVLDFRKQHGMMFRSYRRDLRRLLIDLAYMNADDVRTLLELRREELQDRRADLQRRTRLAFQLKQLVPFGLGVGGAALTYASGDVLGATGSAISALGSASSPHTGSLGAYSYLFAAHQTWGSR